MFDTPHITAALSPDLLRFLQVFFITLLAHFIERQFLNHAEKLAARTDNILDDALIAAARGPLPVLIWVTGIVLALRLIDLPVVAPLVEHLPQLQKFCTVVIISWFCFRLIHQYADVYVAAYTRQQLIVDQTMVDGLSKLARITVAIISALVGMQTLGYNISSLIAFGGVGGLAVGLAARDWVANLIGGLAVHISRPFSVGESIRSPDRQIEGKVEMISWLQTRLRTPNMSVIYVPNSLFTTVVLENPSRITNRRIDLVIGLRHQDVDRVDAIVVEVRKMLLDNAEVDQDKAIVVAFDDFTETSLKLIVRAYTCTTDLGSFHAIKQATLIGIATIVRHHGAEIIKPAQV